MTIIIIEDEALAADRLQGLIEQFDASLEILARLSSVEQAIVWFNHHPMPDLAFVDIQLSDGLCFEIFEAVVVSCPIIFTTSHEQYALEAFGVSSVAYLLKPVKYGQLVKSFQKLEEMQQTFLRQASSLSTPPTNFKSRFLVKNGLQIKTVKAQEVAYFFSEEKISFLVCADQSKFPIDFSLEEIETSLDPDIFFRISRKYIVHIDAIKDIRPYFKGRLKVALNPPSGEDIVVSGERTPAFKAWLDH
ncbi:DNA-binding LytR/AlgR family response regulator [Dyadobacter jejuensis]|uniref:DNA-binding LytR/AlgR family response regulator n=1 Tax=Dyadobacter jejuensis TaxID=1082580 RepID=A0A316AKL1_9BACT|nr:LytTR family DNA-binding domain-containing protein [Dyadobacter jejuensis]PWJ57908.1 DNA-binding LytR/AlgR family response regulator [Dyadobacter jejuensis]